MTFECVQCRDANYQSSGGQRRQEIDGGEEKMKFPALMGKKKQGGRDPAESTEEEVKKPPSFKLTGRLEEYKTLDPKDHGM